VLVIKRIHVRHRLKLADDRRSVAERVHGFYAVGCPLYRSVKDAIAVTSEVTFLTE
jgi:hypothetical protein